jgi:hypothetical protein
MRVARLLGLLLPLSSCARPTTLPPRAASVTCCAAAAERVSAAHRVGSISHRRFTHAELWQALDPLARAPGVRLREIGRSVQDRPIRAITVGSGPTTVLLWSQMHGDEATATMALADLVAWFGAASPAERALRERITAALTVVMVPMLNPDGAELFQRENAAGIDVNRDARRLATPEARALKALRDSIRPAFGFNLHDQGARTLAGPRGRQVAIALLPPAADASGAYGPIRAEAREVAATIAAALAPALSERLARYDDAFEPRAFGDLMQQWGTRTVLIESGALAGDPDKQQLRAVNVAAIATALHAIATGAHRGADVAAYDSLPRNARAANDMLLRGGHLVLPGAEPMRVDLALNFDDAVARTGARLREVGDLPEIVAIDTVDVTGLYLHPDESTLTARTSGRWLRVNEPVRFVVRRGRDAASEVVRRIE